MPRYIDAEVIAKIAEACKQKHPRKHLTWDGLKYLVSKVPTVNAVEIPDCKKCIYYEGIANWHQCENCIGQARNNFLAISEVRP